MGLIWLLVGIFVPFALFTAFCIIMWVCADSDYNRFARWLDKGGMQKIMPILGIIVAVSGGFLGGYGISVSVQKSKNWDEYLECKAQYELLSSTILTDADYLQNLDTIQEYNDTIKHNQKYCDDPWVGALYNPMLKELDIIQVPSLKED